MHKLPCIGMVGYMGSGKNTVAEIISGLGYDVTEKAFAFELRQKACGIFDIDYDQTTTEEGKNTFVEVIVPTRQELSCYDMKEETIDQFYLTFESYRVKHHYIITIRKILQLLGTEVYRFQDSNYWVNCVTYEDGVIFTDTRFPNEGDKIKQEGGILIRVINTSQDTNDVTHESEKYIDSIKCDYTILNDGKSMENLVLEVTKTILDIDK